jgi:hypothetical protein
MIDLIDSFVLWVAMAILPSADFFAVAYHLQSIEFYDTDNEY